MELQQVSNGLIDLEDEMHRLYLTFFPKGKAVKTGFDALPSRIVNLISQYPEETAHVLASGAYRLTRRVFSQPFGILRRAGLPPQEPSGTYGHAHRYVQVPSSWRKHHRAHENAWNSSRPPKARKKRAMCLWLRKKI